MYTVKIYRDIYESKELPELKENTILFHGREGNSKDDTKSYAITVGDISQIEVRNKQGELVALQDDTAVSEVEQLAIEFSTLLAEQQSRSEEAITELTMLIGSMM